MIFNNFELSIQGYSGSDVRLVCKEAAMKPLRRLMQSIEEELDFEKINWSEAVDASKMPGPGPITIEDLTQSVMNTKSSA